MEGDWSPQRLVILEFPSRAAAKAFLADPEAAPLFTRRHRSTSLVETWQARKAETA